MGVPQLEWYIDSITNSYVCVRVSEYVRVNQVFPSSNSRKKSKN